MEDKASSLATRAIEHLRFEPVAVLAHTMPRGLPSTSPDDAGDPQSMCPSLRRSKCSSGNVEESDRIGGEGSADDAAESPDVGP